MQEATSEIAPQVELAAAGRGAVVQGAELGTGSAALSAANHEGLDAEARGAALETAAGVVAAAFEAVLAAADPPGPG